MVEGCVEHNHAVLDYQEEEHDDRWDEEDVGEDAQPERMAGCLR
jgi:hypothetical protein